MTRFELERDIEHQLQRLPPPEAPPTLLPRVLSMAQAKRGRPWYARAWRTWPLTWRLASVAALLAVAIASAVAWPAIVSLATGHAGALNPIASAASDRLAVWQWRAANAFGASRALWRALVQPLAPFAFVLVAVMCAACAACVVALTRVAAERSLRP